MKFYPIVFALLAVACTRSEENEPVSQPVDAVAIRVQQTVTGTTRAAVNEGSEVNTTLLMCDNDNWGAFTVKKQNSITGTTLDDRATVSVSTFQVGASAADLSLNPSLYYNTDGSTPAWIAAVAPAGDVTGTSVAVALQDGLQDVMYAAPVNAGVSGIPVTAALNFKHLTTQLSFAIKMKPATGGDWNGKTVSLKSITLKEATFPQSVDASNGNVTWTASATNLAIPGISNPVVKPTPEVVGTPVMVQASSKVVIDVVFSVGSENKMFYNIPVKNGSDADLSTEAGKAHLITLTLEEPTTPSAAVKVITTATVEPWQEGTAGNATLN